MSRLETRRIKEEKQRVELEEYELQTAQSSKHVSTTGPFHPPARSGSSGAFRLRKFPNSGQEGLNLTAEVYRLSLYCKFHDMIHSRRTKEMN